MRVRYLRYFDKCHDVFPTHMFALTLHPCQLSVGGLYSNFHWFRRSAARAWQPHPQSPTAMRATTTTAGARIPSSTSCFSAGSQFLVVYIFFLKMVLRSITNSWLGDRLKWVEGDKRNMYLRKTELAARGNDWKQLGIHAGHAYIHVWPSK